LKIAVASGKGGTGKTSVAVGLALSLGEAQVLDCDVEEPNAHILIRPEMGEITPVELPFPRIDLEKCDFCGECSRFCQFHALFVAGETALVFPELCHGCGGCAIVCPRSAINEERRQIGRVIEGSSGEIRLVYGELNIGEPLAVPVISAVKAACPVVETIHGADYCLMVTEPTPFGLHDLRVTVEVARQLEVSVGVVVNFAGVGDRGVYDYCEREGIPVMLEIPYDRRIAELYSRGIHFVEEMPEWKGRFVGLAERIGEVCGL